MKIFFLLLIFFSCSTNKSLPVAVINNTQEFKSDLFTGTVNSEEAPTIITKKGFDFLTIKTKSTPIYCTFYTQPIYLASVHENFVTKSLYKMSQYALAHLELKVIGNGFPFIETHHRYINSEKGKRKAGLFKVASFDHNGSAHVCVHDNVDLEENFSQIISDLALSLHSSLYRDNENLTKELNLIKVNGKFLGFAQKLKSKSSGRTTIIENMGIMVPRSEKDLIASDSLSTQYYDSNGVLTSGIYSNLENSQTKFAMTLTKKSAREYMVSGSFMGEEIHEQKIKTQRELKNSDIDFKKMSDKKDKNIVLTSSIFSPGINPEGMTDLKMRYVEKIAGDLYLYEVESESVKTYLHMRDDGVSPYTKSIMGSMVLETFLKYESP